jgi:hypothetical protein
MANEQLFTTKKGLRVPVKEFQLTPSMMLSLMRLQEDFQSRGEHLSMTGVVIHVIDKGIQTTRNYWKNIEQSTRRRNLGKAMEYLLSKGADAKQIAEFLQAQTGKKVELGAATSSVVPDPESEPEVIVIEGEAEMTEQELDAATSPN